MTTNREKRSSIDGMTDQGRAGSGVGGRQREGHPAVWGGGYLDICTGSGSPVPDPRLDQLAELVPVHWVRVAHQIGVDNFLLVWQMLSEDDQIQDNFGRVHIPSFSGWLRYQRNRLIATMARRGESPQQIHETLKKRLGYDLSLGHIRDLMKQ